ncbi:receptor-like protein kinase [Dorcoceras hygrometricum]|uniref:Receptor-like protein kinase n=1 Tax=Dorcoceras hygrometricum TaxID=472368 RepID=A0A2Z7AI21_9LAMI|nr:receptor-like protein kinase [Dorcoceras hygrometricum]
MASRFHFDNSHQTLAFATAQPSCINNGNFTSASTYKANLDTLISSLPRNVNENGFYNASAGQAPDTAYASVLCRGDVQLETCRGCIRDAAASITSSCPNYKQAAMFNELCTLRYSDESMFGVMATLPGWFLWNQQNASSPEQFMADTRRLLDDLRGEAANGGSLRKVAAGNRSTADFQIVFAFVQCTPDLTPENCFSCLIGAASDIPKYCNSKIGCRVLRPSCNNRFEILPFYNETRLHELQTLIKSPPPPGLRQPPPSSPPPPGSTQPPAPVQQGKQIIVYPARALVSDSFVLYLLRNTGKQHDNKTRTMIIVVVSVVLGITLALCIGILLMKRAKRKKPKGIDPAHGIDIAEALQYDFRVIKAATSDFSVASKLGQGGFGAVYKGKLAHGQDVAVKRLSLDSSQGDVEFKNEVSLVAKLQHRNLVKLLGFSIEGKERLLVYEFVDNASLDRFIFDPTKRNDLDWERRCKIIVGISRGLLYLHEESRLKIIHRDLKASNILLDADMNPKIADFGMARLFAIDETQANTNRIVGTYGYMSPEYALYGKFSIKSDVFSFGVLILEIVSGKQNRAFQDGENVEDLLSLAWKHWRQGTVEDLIDPFLRSDQSTRDDILRYIHVGLLCVQDNPNDRPTMASVVLMISSITISMPVPLEPTYSMTHGYNSKLSTSQQYFREEQESSGSSSLIKSIQSNDSLKTDMSKTGVYPR